MHRLYINTINRENLDYTIGKETYFANSELLMNFWRTFEHRFLIITLFYIFAPIYNIFSMLSIEEIKNMVKDGKAITQISSGVFLLKFANFQRKFAALHHE